MRSRTGLARLEGTLGAWRTGAAGWEWNGSQPGQGATELGFPRPALGRCRVRRAERVSRPGQGRPVVMRVLVVTICSPKPMRAVQRARLCAG